MQKNTFRIYLKVDNLYTLTKYPGYTPEIASYKNGATSDDVLSSGIDMGVYPVTSVYSFGIDLTF